MVTDKYGVDEVQFLRSHRPLARRLTELEAENESLRQQVAAFAPPEGWVLVPMVPTEAMEHAERRLCSCRTETWQAMIAARPEVP